MAIYKELTVLNSHLAPLHAKEASVAAPIRPSEAAKIVALRKPEWLKIRPPGGEKYTEIKSMLRERKLHTVCEEAHCPNVAECWSSGTATLMLGSDTCTRACRFCAIKTSRTPPPLNPDEPFEVAKSVAALGLNYVVLTAVDRDDLPDGGASHFANTIREIKRLRPSTVVEALVPDFRKRELFEMEVAGVLPPSATAELAASHPLAVTINVSAIQTIVDSGVDVYAHNIETVKRLQYRVRDPRAGYIQSLSTLQIAKDLAKHSATRGGQRLYTKSSIMLGLGETESELYEAFDDLRAYDVDVLTLGQYLRPSMQHLPVEKYVEPADFERYQREAQSKHFLYVASGPMVRSSYRAAEFFMKGLVLESRKSEVEHSRKESGNNGT